MKLLRDCWAALLEVFNVITLSPTLNQPASQQILRPDHGALMPLAETGGPVFTPPSRPQDPDSVIQCDYSPMGKEWVSFSLCLVAVLAVFLQYLVPR